MDNVIQRLYENHSDLLYTIIFFLGFILSLNNLANQTDDSPFWLYIMLACTFIGGYYFLNFFSRFMDKYEPTSHFADIGKPMKSSTITFVYIIGFSLNVIVSWINSNTIEGLSKNLTAGLFILQIILFFVLIPDLFQYLSRTSTVKMVSYGGENVIENSNTEYPVELKEENRFKWSFLKNLPISLNVLNFCLLIGISIIFA